MEIFLISSLAFLEVTFVFVGLLLLHSLRKIVFGSAAFYIAIGLLLVFTQLVSATELKVMIGFPGADFYIAQSILFLPYLAIILIVYVSEGTLATQRLIIGAMVTLGFYVYLSYLTIIQCGWGGYTVSQGPSADPLEYLLRYSQRTMASSILAQTLDLFLIPIFFQRLKNMSCRLFFCVLGSLMLTQIVDTFVYVTACYWGDPQWWMHMKSSYIVKAFLTIWLSIIATIYLSRIEKEKPGTQGRGALDILVSFLGSYGRAQALQKNLQEWEGRYRIAVESSSDMILLLDREGKILDANNAAARILAFPSKNDLIGSNFNDILIDRDEFPFDIDLIWKSIGVSAEATDELPNPDSGQNIELHITSADGSAVEVNAFINSIHAESIPLLIIFGKDVTEQNRLEKEKEELREQLNHAQRLESVGKLAGGVAHDFNNYIHAIRGNIELLLYMHDIEDEKVLSHLNRVNDIADQAANLTQQLLGFARKGKYKVELKNLNEIVEDSVRLFSPQSIKNIEFRLNLAKAVLCVKCDVVQIKQIFLNIMINARDAIGERIGADGSDSGIIAISTGSADQVAPQFEAAAFGKEHRPAHSYCYASFRDNGNGIDKDVISRIFDPFFTTKPVGKGTGMGLAMVYGTVSNHHGFVYVESEPGMGACFYIFLPSERTASAAPEASQKIVT